MRAGRSIARTFTLVVSVCTTLIFTAAIGYSYHRSRVALEKEVATNVANLVQGSIHRVETTLRAIAKATEGVARALETGHPANRSLHALLKATLLDNGEIHGFGAAFDPDPVLDPPVPTVPYFFRRDGRLIFAPEDSYEYLGQDWYQIPKELGALAWSEPYLDRASGGTLMTSCSVPIFVGTGEERKVRGVVMADVSLEGLTDLVESIRVLRTGYSVLLSRNGTFLTHPDRDLVMNETIFGLAESLDRPELRDLGKKMVRGGSEFLAYTTIGGVSSRMYYAPVPSTGWTLVVIFPEAELYADVHSLTLVVTVIALAGILLLTGAVHGIARAVTAPLGALATATEEIAAGNFDAGLPPVGTRDEVGQLTLAFAAMTSALRDYIRDLTETTAAKERIQSELKVATDIQASLLPRLFPAFPDRPEFDIFATMDPAKEVGGDFYDFFFVNPTNLCFLVADVADKGVPAALYMMVAKTLLKAEGQRLGEPDQILACVNTILAADNDSCMFTTVFCAILDTESGEVRFANAGHNRPVLISDSTARLLPVRTGFVLGPMADVVYTTERMMLRPGDVLFLYTDGITEATNRTDELYGEKRLLKALQTVADMELVEMLAAIRAEVVRHADGAPQSDDVTMIAIKYRGMPNADR